jgi:hypothetical protein
VLGTHDPTMIYIVFAKSKGVDRDGNPIKMQSKKFRVKIENIAFATVWSINASVGFVLWK